MNLSDIQEMTDEQLRIKVAELCGAKWKCLYAASHATLTMSRKGSTPNWSWCKKDAAHPIDDDTIPDYSHDLNAMQDAVASVVKKRGVCWTVTFNHCLYKVLGHHDHVEHEAIHAKARQRAEAFVLAVEKG